MKNIVIYSLLTFFLFACNSTTQRYTQNSPEIETVKSVINDYNAKNYEGLLTSYADTAKASFNRLRIPSKDLPNYHKTNDKNYSSRGFIDEGQEYEMVIDDEGKTWVNFWGTWKGTLKANNKEYIIPIHLTARFIDGKIVENYGYWDTSEIASTLQNIAIQNNLPPEEMAYMTTIKKVVDGWNAHDIANLKSVSVNNLKRSSNGSVEIKSIDEYEGFMKTFVSAFPDFKVKTNSIDLSGNKAFVNWTVSGTHKGDFGGNAGTGKKIKIPGLSVWTMNGDGKLTREDAFFDNTLVYDQLGISQP